ncbi:MAG: phytoene dehydrogenase, partial [Desulfobacterales bacterium]
ERRLGFVESIFQLPQDSVSFARDNTITFFNTGETFNYASPAEPVDYSSGVICLPSRFKGLPPGKNIEVRGTHLANFKEWKKIYSQQETYVKEKEKLSNGSLNVIEEIIGPFRKNIIYQNTFTPVTIERYTSKKKGAIYGHPTKIKDGDLGLGSIFLAGTDQGFLGIIGSMLSGVSIANQQILPKL